MADVTIIARPYALAAFECAREAKEIPAWSAFLNAAATMVGNDSVKRLIANPETQASQLVALFSEVLVSQLNNERRNFLHLLAQNKRLMVLPDINQAFNTYVAALEKISTVRIVSAVELNNDTRQRFTTALTKRLSHDVHLDCKVDPSIIAGAIIYIGDSVIDGSIRGKLSRLQQNLTA